MNAPAVKIPSILPALETERLILRPLTLEDAGDVFAYASEAEVARYVPWEAHRSVEDSRRFLETVLEKHRRASRTPGGS